MMTHGRNDVSKFSKRKRYFFEVVRPFHGPTGNTVLDSSYSLLVQHLLI